MSETDLKNFEYLGPVILDRDPERATQERLLISELRPFSIRSLIFLRREIRAYVKRRRL